MYRGKIVGRIIATISYRLNIINYLRNHRSITLNAQSQVRFRKQGSTVRPGSNLGFPCTGCCLFGSVNV